MTRDEQRKACIEAMSAIALAETGLPWTPLLTRAFDSLHGIARVEPADVDLAMEFGDLTNPPETKP